MSRSTTPSSCSVGQPGRPPIRFGLQVNPAADQLATVGIEAEEAGFDVVTVSDHIGRGSLSPLPALANLAAATTHINLGTMVLNNDMRNPVQLAWEAATLQELSGGRFELGLGAGHTPHEYAETGIAMAKPAIRKQRLAESTEIINGLLRGETVDVDGQHHQVSGAALDPPTNKPTILIGGNGTALLTHAARHADAIGLQGLGKTKEDGHRHSVRFEIEHLQSQLAIIEASAKTRTVDQPPLELAALVQVAEITSDRETALAEVMERVEGISQQDATVTPYLAIGSIDELAHQFIEARDRWGISYFTVRSIELAPVIAEVRRLENVRLTEHKHG